LTTRLIPTCNSIADPADPIGAVESVKAASDIYAPVSGVVTAINETLSDQPSLLNKAPQGDGEWRVHGLIYFALMRIPSVRTSHHITSYRLSRL
jgi:hypothetical protein